MCRSMILGMAIVCGVMMTVVCDNGTEPADVPVSTKILELLQPQGGETYKVNQTVLVKWRINDATKVSSVGVKLSIDSGKTFPGMITVNGSVFPPTAEFSWTITADQVSDKCVVKVYEYNGEATINDRSATFRITN
jgi:hypothetical protein